MIFWMPAKSKKCCWFMAITLLFIMILLKYMSIKRIYIAMTRFNVLYWPFYFLFSTSIQSSFLVRTGEDISHPRRASVIQGMKKNKATSYQVLKWMRPESKKTINKWIWYESNFQFIWTGIMIKTWISWQIANFLFLIFFAEGLKIFFSPFVPFIFFEQCAWKTWAYFISNR